MTIAMPGFAFAGFVKVTTFEPAVIEPVVIVASATAPKSLIETRSRNLSWTSRSTAPVSERWKVPVCHAYMPVAVCTHTSAWSEPSAPVPFSWYRRPTFAALQAGRAPVLVSCHPVVDAALPLNVCVPGNVLEPSRVGSVRTADPVLYLRAVDAVSSTMLPAPEGVLPEPRGSSRLEIPKSSVYAPKVLFALVDTTFVPTVLPPVRYEACSTSPRC